MPKDAKQRARADLCKAKAQFERADAQRSEREATRADAANPDVIA